jgi:phosphatidylglycerol:prolipoprotein diacylglycerol transferase
MYPVLLELGPLQIRAYGVLLSLAFVIGVWMAARKGAKQGIEPSLTLDLSIVVILASIIGSRAYYVLVNWIEFSDDPLSAFSVWRGGLSMYGGLILAFIASYVFLRKKQLSFNRMADIVAPSLAIGVAVTRIGCFFNGCCFGRATSSFPGMSFPPNSEAGYVLFGKMLHPTQLYSSIYGLFIFLILLVAGRRPLREGALFGLFLVLYSVSRFSIDFLRYYDPNSSFEIAGVTFNYNHIVSLLLFLYGVIAIINHSRQTGEVVAGLEKG